MSRNSVVPIEFQRLREGDKVIALQSYSHYVKKGEIYTFYKHGIAGIGPGICCREAEGYVFLYEYIEPCLKVNNNRDAIGLLHKD